MNKRQKQKYIKRNNIRLMNEIIKPISDKFTIIDKVWLDGYFCFNFGAYSILHFKLKEIPNWKFGIWKNEDGYEIFGDHNFHIDKFKPNRCYLSYENEVKNLISDIENIIKDEKFYIVDSYIGDLSFPWRQDKNDKTWYRGYQAVWVEKEDGGYKYIRDESVTQQSVMDKYYNELVNDAEDEIRLENEGREKIFNLAKELVKKFDFIKCVGLRDKDAEYHFTWSHSCRYEFVFLFENDYEITEKFDDYVINKLQKLEKSRECRQGVDDDDYQYFYRNKNMKICQYKFYK